MPDDEGKPKVLPIPEGAFGVSETKRNQEGGDRLQDDRFKDYRICHKHTHSVGAEGENTEAEIVILILVKA